MKRFLTTLAILMVVILAGLTALVLLVNPNDFRHYLIDKVEQKSGYHLVFQGEMRWHVWPRLSIITGPISLTAPGATKPAISADNMRLDVSLWPLISHQLSVEQIVISNAVLRATPDSEAKSNPDAPIAPEGLNRISRKNNNDSKWLFEINKIKLTDSLLIWQLDNDTQLNMRNIMLSLSREDDHFISVNFSSNVSKDQQDLTFSLKSKLNIADYPHQIAGEINQLEYKISGINLPTDGISGNATLLFDYLHDQQPILTLSNLAIDVNDSNLTGNLVAHLGKSPDYQLNITSTKLDLDKILGWPSLLQPLTETKITPQVSPKPVIATIETDSYDLSYLKQFPFQATISADKLIYRGLVVDSFKSKITNKKALLNVSQLEGGLLGGNFELPISLNYQNSPVIVTAKPKFNHVRLAPLLQSFDMPTKLDGSLMLAANLSGPGYDKFALLNFWSGNANVILSKAQLTGLNIASLIQHAFSRLTDKIDTPQNLDDNTQIENLTVDTKLNKGMLSFSNLVAYSDAMSIDGNGWLNLAGKSADVKLLVNINKGWYGNDNFINKINQLSIPLRIYGKWKNLQYQLNIEKLLRDEFQSQAKKALDSWLEKEVKSKN
ncbi:outer membrane assembly protein AsmA [Candidatus Arsenophonus nilaparvatae]|uniref:outer membrane assembly protein AsmA n=1 Tax=Candidatus Arsenophonus nilaparvatae TaxID=1247023 RepID=UPI0005098823|nr:outer membrane assembly protein AsmA [Candidatus Arsenophonus nilaparvatae]